MPTSEQYIDREDPYAKLTLVLGVDGSGKSTYLNGLQEKFGVVVLEPTSTPRAKLFKSTHIETMVDSDFVSEREDVYLDLNNHFNFSLKTELDSGNNVATTGSSLVTLVSHGLMKSIVDVDYEFSLGSVLGNWEENEQVKPGNIVFVHAPHEVILSRIVERQQQGDIAEKFWGFNAPYFLYRYQDTWHQVMDWISSNTDIKAQRLNSASTTPQAMLESYLPI